MPLATGSSLDLFPGQYIYVMIPMISLEMHRFYICWVDEYHIWLLIQPSWGFESFTSQLTRINHEARIFVEGIYGPMTNNLASYGTVMFITCGIKIAAVLPYLQWLREQHKERRVVTQRISLIWTIDKAEHLDWVRDWVNHLLFEDITLVSKHT